MTGKVAPHLSNAEAQSISDAALGPILDRSLGAIVSIFDRDTRLLYVNAQYAVAFNTTPEKLIGKALWELYAPEHVASFEGYVNRAFNGEFVNYERLVHIDGVGGVWHTISLAPWLNERGEILGVVHAAMRVHELKVTLEALRVANQKLSFHNEHSPLTLIDLDGTLRITNCSPQIATLLGVSSDSVIGLPLKEILGDKAGLNPLYDALAALQRGDLTSTKIDTVLYRRNGETVHSEWFCSALTQTETGVSSISCLIHDTTERVVAQAQLLEHAITDALTGLLNRRAFQERLEQAQARTERSGARLALVFADLDGFKAVNDKYGHDAGDDVLREVSRRIKTVCRATDVIARFGGDEFVILAEADADAKAIEALAARLAQALTFALPLGQGEARVGVSIGVASERVPGDITGGIIAAADAAMYAAKRAGRGRVVFA